MADCCGFSASQPCPAFLSSVCRSDAALQISSPACRRRPRSRPVPVVRRWSGRGRRCRSTVIVSAARACRRGRLCHPYSQLNLLSPRAPGPEGLPVRAPPLPASLRLAGSSLSSRTPSRGRARSAALASADGTRTLVWASRPRARRLTAPTSARRGAITATRAELRRQEVPLHRRGRHPRTHPDWPCRLHQDDADDRHPSGVVRRSNTADSADRFSLHFVCVGCARASLISPQVAKYGRCACSDGCRLPG